MYQIRLIFDDGTYYTTPRFDTFQEILRLFINNNCRLGPCGRNIYDNRDGSLVGYLVKY
jgi:hypothetical protein